MTDCNHSGVRSCSSAVGKANRWRPVQAKPVSEESDGRSVATRASCSPISIPMYDVAFFESHPRRRPGGVVATTALAASDDGNVSDAAFGMSGR